MFLFLVLYSTIACYITLTLGKINETFEEYHDSMVLRLIDDEYTTAFIEYKFKNSFFSVMSTDERIKYCNEAKDFAGLDAITPITNTKLKFLATSLDEVILECRTLPISYLRTLYRDTSIIFVMMWENKFFKYHYEVQITNSEPIIYSKNTRSRETRNIKMEAADLLDTLRSTSFDNDRIKGVYVSENMTIADFLVKIGSSDLVDQCIKNNRFSRLEEDEPIQVCVAAKRHLRLLASKNNDAQIVPVLQNDRVELAQIFDFGNEIGDRVALHCPSTPSMYVYFKYPTKPYSEDLQIVLVQN